MNIIQSLVFFIMVQELVFLTMVGCQSKKSADGEKADIASGSLSVEVSEHAEERELKREDKRSDEAALKAMSDAPPRQSPSEPSNTPPQDCAECRKWACSNYSGFKLIDQCYKGEEVALCKSVVDCADRTGCANQDVADCYCGKGHKMAECLAVGGFGVCKEEIIKAAKTDVSTEVATRYLNPQYPLGRAMSLLGCYQELCPHCVQGNETPLASKIE